VLFVKKQKAIEYLSKAIELNPKYSDAYYNLGNVYSGQNKPEFAKNNFMKAIELNPKNINYYSNLAKVYLDENDIENAEKYHNKVLEIDPHNIAAKWNLALCYLLRNQYEKGFDYYRFRYHKDNHNKNTSLIEEDNLLTKDVDIKDKTIFVYAEQGYGDSIQFVRFLPQLVKKGAKVICLIESSCKQLFELNYPEIEFVLTKDVEYDYHLPLLDIAYFLKLEYGDTLKSNRHININKDDSDELFNKYSLSNDKIKIGFVWQGSKGHSNDKNRSIPLETMLEYINKIDSNIEFCSLQYGTTIEEDKIFDKYDRRIVKMGHDIHNFYDLALAIDNMDMILSIDTAIIHLAASMGKKTMVMLPFSPDWRWGLTGQKSIWYDSIELYRQKEIGNWDSVFEEIIAKLGSNKIIDRTINENSETQDIQADLVEWLIKLNKGEITIKEIEKSSDKFLNIMKEYKLVAKCQTK
jgi:tetratricopeptide (TPR) repeat protein